MKTFLRFGLLMVILLIGMTGLAIYWTFYKPLPDYSSTIRVEGIHQPVDIHWDPYGVPHIYAQNEEDLYFAIGYVHAQDRLWQMSLTQMAVEGRFAEFLGEDVIDFDKYQRTLGFWETAKKIEEEAPEQLQQLLLAYSGGVNHYADNNRRNLPIEFTLLGMSPYPWTPTHSYALSRMMSWEMNSSWWSEITYGYLSDKLAPYILQELYPGVSYSVASSVPNEESQKYAASLLPMVQLEFDFRNTFERSGAIAGSNAWAVSGNRTTTGLPLLAGDPHLDLNMPGKWYEVHLNIDGQNLSGATIPGAPIVVLGQNEELAWSLTNLMADDTDFFLEIPNPNNNSEYVADSLGQEAVFESFQLRNEIIRVKDKDDQLFQVRSTRHGPVISDIYPDSSMIDDKMITMKWTGHEASQELWALYRINWAESMQEFETALEDFRSPGQNFIYADRSGNIGMYSAGAIPLRDYNPLQFRHGWDPDYDWQGWIPFEEMPRTINPPSGWVGNANNQVHADDYPYYIATFWEPSSRIQRLEEYMIESDTLTPAIFQQMQLDTYSIHARGITEFILPILRQGEDSYNFSQIIPYLENWDFRYDGSSTAASLFDAFFIELTRNTLSDELEENAFQNFIRHSNHPVRVMTNLLEENSMLFNEENGTNSNMDQLIRKSMNDAVVWLTERYGDEPFQWRWENIHTITFSPPLFADAAENPEAPGALKMIVNNLMSKGPYPVSGHAMSLNKGQYSWLNPFEMTHGPSIRRIIDFSSLNRTLSVIPTGQSGNPLSNYFGDQTDLWLTGQYRYLYQDSTFFREVSFQTLTLEPTE